MNAAIKKSLHIKIMESLRIQQDIEYNKSLRNDILKDIKEDRDEIRKATIKLLQTRFPSTAEELFDKSGQKLLRINPRFLTAEERFTVQNIKDEISRIQDGECYDKSKRGKKKIFKLRIPGILPTFCFDLEDIFKSGLINDILSLGNVYINIPETGENILYPLPDDDVERLIGEALLEHGMDLDRYPKLKFPELEAVNLELLRLTNRL